MTDPFAKTNKRLSTLAGVMNIIAKLELSPPRKMIFRECPNGCRSGWAIPSYHAQCLNCDTCGTPYKFDFKKKYTTGKIA